MKRSWKSSRAAAGALFLVAYLPLLLSAPGKIPGDTKLYLYLDPWRLISDSLWTWDSRQLGGWVPHQNIGYLWPTGPWFAGFDALGIPDWIAHRLWLGTMMLSAGLGVLWLARRMGLRPQAAFIAALAYQLSPFVLPYISRTSALLLPWALLPWLCGVAAAYAIQRRWFHLAIFGALVLSSGGLNATALLMIAPALAK
jgi:arabinofuranan 3-O-arabinosyltransferase